MDNTELKTQLTNLEAKIVQLSLRISFLQKCLDELEDDVDSIVDFLKRKPEGFYLDGSDDFD